MSQRRRYEKAAEEFARLYPNREDIAVYSAPGRTEVGGNHTDHQHGCVLAAAINLDIIAVVSFHNDGVIRIHSKAILRIAWIYQICPSIRQKKEHRLH